MVQRIKVQSGRLVYEATDSSYDMNVDVLGRINVTKELNVGSDSEPGLIATGDGQELNITPGLDGNINITTEGTGKINLNGSNWPTGFGTAGYALTTDGAGNLSWAPGGGGSPSNTVGTGIAAAGTDLATATPLVDNFNVVESTTVGGGVSLPLTPIGLVVHVLNSTADDILVYPDTLTQIDANLGPYTLEAGFRVSLVLATSTQWYTIIAPFAPV